MRVEVFCLKGSKDKPVRETFKRVHIRRRRFKRRRGGRFIYLFQYSAFILSSFVFLTCAR